MKKTDIMEILLKNPKTVWQRSDTAGQWRARYFIIDGFVEDKMDKYAKRSTTYAVVRPVHSDCCRHIVTDVFNGEGEWVGVERNPDTRPLSERVNVKIAEYTGRVSLSTVGGWRALSVEDFAALELKRYEAEEIQMDQDKMRETIRSNQRATLERLLVEAGIVDKVQWGMVGDNGAIRLDLIATDNLIKVLTDVAGRKTEQEVA